MANLDEQILKELQLLRKLKMMELSESGFSQQKMADAIGVSQNTVSRLMANSKKVGG
ncbi:MAG: helix-turn-helix domain-containing protein [Pseudomonadota bacterium]